MQIVIQSTFILIDSYFSTNLPKHLLSHPQSTKLRKVVDEDPKMRFHTNKAPIILLLNAVSRNMKCLQLLLNQLKSQKFANEGIRTLAIAERNTQHLPEQAFKTI